MLVAESRPRNLKWFHAGPLLYGDWGTSRLYVLGLAFFYTANTSVLYLLAIGGLMAAVAWAYSIICRSFPDGGGVYTAARQLSPILSVVGATLLLCGYIITVCISVVEASHYFGVPKQFTLPLSVVIIFFIGAVNWLGAKNAGRFALIVAFGALGISAIMALLCVPYLREGFSKISLGPPQGVWPRWTAFTQIVLALAGVEAVANMTGLMKRPVRRTAKRTLVPVLIEVAVLNLLFGIAATAILNSQPIVQELGVTTLSQVDLDAVTPDQAAAVKEIRDTAMEVIATDAATNAFGSTFGGIFGKAAAIMFGLLLLSATNTAVMAMVSVLYAMGQDGELPKKLTRLNYSGVPWMGLVASCVVCTIVLFIEHDIEALARKYLIGVCGAITVSVASCAINRQLKILRIERLGMIALGSFLLVVTLTVAVVNLAATGFAASAVVIVLGTRTGLIVWRRRVPAPIPEPLAGWLGEVQREPAELAPSKPRLMLAARGRYQAEFAVDMAKRRDAILFAIFVRTLRVMDVRPGQVPRVEDDPDAQTALGSTALLARAAGVPFVPIYVTSTDIAEEILDYTVTYGCDTLITGKSRRSMFARKLEGDVITRIAEDLPDNVALITRAADSQHPTGQKITDAAIATAEAEAQAEEKPATDEAEQENSEDVADD